MTPRLTLTAAVLDTQRLLPGPGRSPVCLWVRT
jgi:hypothetical protein